MPRPASTSGQPWPSTSRHELHGRSTMSNDTAITLENALKVDRPILGNDAPIALFRLIRLVALEEIVGRGASATYYHAGKKLGMSLGMTKVDQFLKLCTDLRIGQIEVIPQSD